MMEKTIALRAVLQAAKLCQQVQADKVTPKTLEKRDRSPVTIADFGSQALVCRALREAFPEDPIVAEEHSQALRQNPDMLAQVTEYVGRQIPDASPQQVCAWIDSGGGEVGPRFWTLDPIDGTKGFLRRDQYAIALALLVEGQVTLGVLACPNLPWDLTDPHAPRGCAFVAVRGEGAVMVSLDGKRIRSIRVATEHPRFAESFESAHGDQAAQERIARRLGITAEPIRMDSQAKYGLVARGDAAIYLRLPNPATPDYRECLWDHAAGSIVVEEAGGRVTDAEGAPLDFLAGRRLTRNRGILATNGAIHPQAVQAIRGDSS